MVATKGDRKEAQETLNILLHYAHKSLRLEVSCYQSIRPNSESPMRLDSRDAKTSVVGQSRKTCGLESFLPCSENSSRIEVGSQQLGICIAFLVRPANREREGGGEKQASNVCVGSGARWLQVKIWGFLWGPPNMLWEARLRRQFMFRFCYQYEMVTFRKPEEWHKLNGLVRETHINN